MCWRRRRRKKGNKISFTHCWPNWHPNWTTSCVCMIHNATIKQISYYKVNHTLWTTRHTLTQTHNRGFECKMSFPDIQPSSRPASSCVVRGFIWMIFGDDTIGAVTEVSQVAINMLWCLVLSTTFTLRLSMALPLRISTLNILYWKLSMKNRNRINALDQNTLTHQLYFYFVVSFFLCFFLDSLLNILLSSCRKTNKQHHDCETTQPRTEQEGTWTRETCPMCIDRKGYP
jgi:hypothetical protein